MDKRTGMIAALAVLTMLLAGCGNTAVSGNEVSAADDDTPVAGGAVTKVTTEAPEESKAEETEVSEETAETEAPEEDSEEELSQSYEDSATAAFIDRLDGREFSMTFAVYRTDNNEGMELQFEETLEVKGDDCHTAISYPDDTAADTYSIGGVGYQADTKKGEYRTGGVPADISGNMLYSAVLGFDPTAADFVSAESFSDGSVQERFSSAGTEYVITYLNGDVVSVEGNSMMRDVRGFTAGGVGEIKLPDGLKEVSADPDGDGNVNNG